MAIVYSEHSPKQLSTGQSASYDIDAKISYTTTWQVLTTDPLEAPWDVATASGLPRMGEIWKQGSKYDPNVVVTKIEPRRAKEDQSHVYWHVVFSYSPPSLGMGTGTTTVGDPSDDPLKWHDEIEVDFNQFSKANQRAFYEGGFLGGPMGGTPIGKLIPVVNSLGVRYTTPLEGDVSNVVVRITKNRLDYPIHLEHFVDKLNSEPFTIDKAFFYRFVKPAKKHECKCQGISSRFIFENNINYWKTTVTLEYGNWIDEVLDEGIYEADIEEGQERPDGSTVTGQQIPAKSTFVDFKVIVDALGMPMTDPVPLDGKGKPLTKDEIKDGKFVHIKWRKQPAIPFAPLAELW